MLCNLNKLFGGEVLKYLYVCRSYVNIWHLHHFPTLSSKRAYEFIANIFTYLVTTPISLLVLLAPTSE